jgi:hypothetical protein
MTRDISTFALGISVTLALVLLVIARLKNTRLAKLVAHRDAELDAAQRNIARVAAEARATMETAQQTADEAHQATLDAQSQILNAHKLVSDERAQLTNERERIRLHYEAEAQRISDEEHATAEKRIQQANDERERIRLHYQAEAQRISDEEHAAAENRVLQATADAQARLRAAQKLVDEERAALSHELERVRQHYEAEAKNNVAAAEAIVAKMLRELEPLRKFGNLQSAEGETHRLLADAIKTANALREDAGDLLIAAKTAASDQRVEATHRAKEINAQADALLDQATRDAARLVADAHKNAESIAGDAYKALREHEKLELAVIAVRNVINGYGDRYIIPTRSIIDDLAADFGHTEAGRTLTAAREQSRRMVEEAHAAECDYAEESRRATAIRFVIDAFNGRVDGILSRTKHDNYGTLEQEIRDAFSLVNLNGKAFRDARILPAYLDTRLAELKWAVVVQELRQQEREEQRRIKEQMREEEKARREYERALKESEQEEAIIKMALEKARHEAEQANAEQRAKFEAQVAQLNQKLAEAEAKNQRALSMAQQTRKGNVYIISNIGSFGEEVFKIGMTRRLEPMDRIYELSDASVPFDFDVHAMIASDDAPALETSLHAEFEEMRINKVNYRKEFFRVPLDQVRDLLSGKGLETTFTMLADAHEYRETEVLNKMTPEEREKYHLRRDIPADATNRAPHGIAARAEL